MTEAETTGRLAILTSGGDAPGMNAAVRAVALVGRAKGWEVFGVRQGYVGLVEDRIEPLGVADVNPILREGGTILGSARCLEFHERAVRDRARANLRKHDIDGLIVIGGNGSLTGALALSDPDECGEWTPHVIGIPASIDNDLAITSLSIGVDTALNTIVEACDKIADTASAHDRTFLVEVMGRDCGYLAMTSAIAAGADMVLFPEAKRTDEQLVDDVVNAILAVRQRPQRSRRVIAIKAEGVALASERLKERVDAELARRGVGADHPVETRVTVLGHVVRGGRPSAFDRLLGSRLGNVAVRELMAGQTRKMIAWMPPVPPAEEVARRSEVDPYCFVAELEEVIAATEELIRGQSPLARWRASVFDELESVFLL